MTTKTVRQTVNAPVGASRRPPNEKPGELPRSRTPWGGSDCVLL